MRKQNVLEHISYLIKPASASCNLRCPYCFYMDVSDNRSIPNFGKMTSETVENLVKGAFEAVTESGTLQFAFQGGEPTLAGISYYERFIEIVNLYNETKPQVSITYAIQTNGTTLNDKWIELLKDNEFLVGVSLDGYQENTDKFRIDIRKIGQFHQIMKGIELLRSADIDFNILTVLTKDLAKDPKKLYEFYKENDFRYVQIIPCLPNLDSDDNLDALDARGFATFYKVFYDLWATDFVKGDIMSVGLFDNLIPMYLGIQPSQCGMLGKCANQLVVEGDGGVYPCDFYVLDEYKIGDVNTDSVAQLMTNSVVHRFLNEGNNPSPSCKECPFRSMCHGNCKRQNVVLFDETGYCGYQDFLEHSEKSMVKIASSLVSS